MTRGAVLSPCGTYRYALWRATAPPIDAPRRYGETCLFVMLNPSTADARTDDATVRRCVTFAGAWGFGMLAIGNLYALRSTDPRAIREHVDAGVDAVGPENDRWLTALRDQATLVVVAWGALADAERVEAVAQILAPANGNVRCLGRTRSGAPRHPVRLARSTALEPWPGEVAR